MNRLFHFACKAEREVQGRNKHRSSFAGATSTRQSTPRQFTTAVRPPTSTPSHAQETSKNTSVQTPAKSETSVVSTGRTRDITCHRCHGIGHIARDCPNRRALFVNADGEYTSASDCDDEYALAATDHAGGQDNDDIEEVHLHPESLDQYPSLIVKLALSAKEKCEEQNQRHNLFQSKVLVKGHTVKMIIDSGSCNNLASEEMVKKLGLTTHPHPHPYHIQWFNTCGKMKVTRLVKIPFSIGSYHDQIECDVVHMQACSVILGRPWQYDREVVFDGRTNTYKFMFDGKRVVLHSMTPAAALKDDLARLECEKKTKSENQIIAKHPASTSKIEPSTTKNEIKLKGALLASKYNICALDEPDSCCYALFCKDPILTLATAPSTLYSLPPAITNLLQEYEDVFHDEIPPRMANGRESAHNQEDGIESRTTPIQEGEDDEDITSSDTLITSHAPMIIPSPSPVRSPETALTSNRPSAFMPTPIWVILDFMERLSRYLSNASGLMSKFISSQRESPKQDSAVAETELGPWAL